ncbi:hypothetical protein RJ639_014456 [Escallonia herrerae]|uniref:GHMP kinase C-terminal domain-containing protein n=1 Tax=Escallonia herrerae TaxID=1293975 RepID=A0AA88VIR8_9ASTE|nr:hypothetical protein RJ639_014456 [Escallonia herrerae]
MPLPEPFVTGSLIKKLPGSWSDYKSMMKHKRKEMTLEDVIVHIRIEEKNRSREKAAKAKEFTSKANLIEERHDRPHGNQIGRTTDLVVGLHGQRPKPNHLKPQGEHGYYGEMGLEVLGVGNEASKNEGSVESGMIEPESQTQLLDATMNMEGVLLAGVPGAGGFDAVFAVTLGDASSKLIKVWSSHNVLAMLVREDPHGVSLESSDPRTKEITSAMSSVQIK